MKAFACSYFHNGSRWALTIHAEDWTDAELICKAHMLQLDGEEVCRVPARLGWAAKLICWLKNRQKGEK